MYEVAPGETFTETVCDDRSMMYATEGYLHDRVDFYSKTEYFFNVHSNILQVYQFLYGMVYGAAWGCVSIVFRGIMSKYRF